MLTSMTKVKLLFPTLPHQRHPQYPLNPNTPMVLEKNENHWFFDFVWGRDSLPPARAAAVPPGIAKYTFKVCTILKSCPKHPARPRRGPQRMAAGCFSHACRGSRQPSLQTSELHYFIAIPFQWLSLKTFFSIWCKRSSMRFQTYSLPSRKSGGFGSEVFRGIFKEAWWVCGTPIPPLHKLYHTFPIF